MMRWHGHERRHGEAERRRIPADFPPELLEDDELMRETVHINHALHSWLDSRRWRWTVGSSIGVALLAVLAVISIGVAKTANTAADNVGRLDRLQKADAVGSLTGSYRTCVRSTVGRLEIHLASSERGEPELLRKRQQRFPILDCSPLLSKRGTQAVPLSVDQQIRARKFFGRTYRAPIIREGIVKGCPDNADAQRQVTRWQYVSPRCKRPEPLPPPLPPLHAPRLFRLSP